MTFFSWNYCLADGYLMTIIAMIGSPLLTVKEDCLEEPKF